MTYMPGANYLIFPELQKAAENSARGQEDLREEVVIAGLMPSFYLRMLAEMLLRIQGSRLPQSRKHPQTRRKTSATV